MRIRRSRGRPPAVEAQNVREALLEAARDLFLRYGFRAVSSRQIAAAANANVAMIRYYFGSKQGLYREILERVIAPTREQAAAMVAHPEQADLRTLLSMAMRIHAGNPWIAGLIVREVLSPEGSFRTTFIRDIGGRMASIAQRVVENEIARGTLRRGLDPQLVVLSMLSLAIFPFLAYPVTNRLFGITRDEASVQRLLEHTQQLLIKGFGAEEN